MVLQTRSEMLTALPLVLVLLTACLSTQCMRVASQAPQDAAAGETASGLPAIPTVFAGWVAAGEVQRYAGDDLYLYINGGAVTWIECGFRQVSAREYVNDENDRLMLEIYEMAGPAASRCIYQRRSGEGGEPLELGDGGRIYDYYLEFHSGRFLVTLTSLDATTGPVSGLVDLAGMVFELLPPGRDNLP